MFRQAGLHRAPERDVRDARHSVEAEGWKVFVLADGIHDHESFVRAATALFPLDPPWHGRSWDAFDDSLWEGLYQLPERRIAILWPDALTLAASDPKTYEMVIDCLDTVSRSLSDAEATVGKPKEVSVLVGI